MSGRDPESRLFGELKRAKRELTATRTALEQRDAALARMTDVVFGLVVAGRLCDVDVLWRTGIAGKVIGPDGQVDLELLERLIVELLQVRPELGAASVGALV